MSRARNVCIYGTGEKKEETHRKPNCAVTRAIQRLKENHGDVDVINDARGFRVNAHLSCTREIRFVYVSLATTMFSRSDVKLTLTAPR